MIEIKGYASLFGIKDLAQDVVKEGAFKNTLINIVPFTDIKMLYQHDMRQKIGSWTKVVEDDRGLYVEGLIDDKSSESILAQKLIKGKSLRGLSIGFRTLDFEPLGQGRLLKEIDLREISIVAHPMNLLCTFTYHDLGDTQYLLEPELEYKET